MIIYVNQIYDLYSTKSHCLHYFISWEIIPIYSISFCDLDLLGYGLTVDVASLGVSTAIL
jgi:hypothetical protein